MNGKIIVAILFPAVLLGGCFGGGQNTGGQLLGVLAEVVSEVSSAAQEGASAEALLELPSSVPGETVIRHGGYVISYNTSNKIPNWVAYELTSSELDGDEERGDRMFSMDPSCKKPQAMREDYSGSGWTKGHMAPAADFTRSATAMDETFYLTNVCPQNERLNAKDWEYLERQVRRWAGEFGSVWVVTGPVVGENRYGRIGERGVVVPDSFFKAVLARKNGKYRSIAFVMDNDSGRYYLRDCACSVNELEDLTGLDFFPALDDTLENAVESQLRLSDWGISK